MKKIAIALGMLLAASAVAGPLDGLHMGGLSKGDQAKILRGLEISPVALNLHGRNIAKVGMGSYLVNAVGGCNDCHTNPSYTAAGDPFKGLPKVVNAANYLAGGQKFGPFTSRNLTPEANGKPAGMTFAEFRLAIRTGKDLDLAHPAISPLLQVMPWPTYQDMVDDDIAAIYEFLSAIPAAKPGP